MKPFAWINFYLLATSAAMASNLTDPAVSVTGTSTSQQTVSVTITDSAGPIYYTTDGTTPTTSSGTISSGSTLLLAENTVLKAQAIQNSTTTSDLVVAQFTNAAQVSAGTSHTLSIRNDGTVWAWGDNSAGELGNGSLTASNVPVEVMVNAATPLTGIVAVAAGTQESYAVDNQGHVWAWGLNTSGQLGTGGNTNVIYPTTINGISGAVAVASLQGHSLALTGGGAVWSWGANNDGQAGNGSTGTWVTTPVQVVGGSQGGQYISNIVAIATGANHSLALDKTGKVYAWGDNTYGQLGNGDTTFTQKDSPVYATVSGSDLTGVVGISASTENSNAILGTGSVYAWGDNSIGELGNGTTGTHTSTNVTPAQISSLSSIEAVSNGIALSSNGTLWTWGDNTNGRLGVGLPDGYADLPLNVQLLGTLPSISVTAGNAQSVTDGTLSSAFTITATSFDAPLANTWVNFYVPQSEGNLTINSNGTQLSPIVGVETNSQGQATVYLNPAANATGPIQLIASSGSAQATFSAIVSLAVASNAAGEPTMPEWFMLIMAGFLIYFATRPRTKPMA